MRHARPQRLSAKLVGIQILALFVALASISLTLLVSWRLEGSAAAINDAGSLRMRTYRLAYLAQEIRHGDSAGQTRGIIAEEIAAFDRVVHTLRVGDPARPLFVPRTAAVDDAFAAFDRGWVHLEAGLLRIAEGADPEISRAEFERFVAVVNALVITLERDIDQTTSLLRSIQLGLLALAIAGAVALIYLAFVFIIRPVHQLHEGLQRMARGDFGARVPVESQDEFGALAAGFNDMAASLEASYRHLEERVANKTRSLAEQNARVSTLYDLTAFFNAPGTQEELARGFLRRVLAATGAKAGAVRLVSRAGGTLHLFVVEGLDAAFTEREQCLHAGQCLCGESALKGVPIVHALMAQTPPLQASLPHCSEAGFATVAAYPIAAQNQVLGVFNLFYVETHESGPEERHMLESLGQHLGVAIENVRLVSRDRELAISEERNLLAQELHDSIAQALAFLNLQVQMLRQSLATQRYVEATQVVAEIEAGVQESYADVRELLVHFRTRMGEGDLEHAIRTQLAKFQHQTGVSTTLLTSGAGVPLAPDDQLQVMHILQEALSNVRKHAHASRVDVELQRGARYRFMVRDDGCGFELANAPGAGGDHVGLRIMRERATRIGGAVTVASTVGKGTTVHLDLPTVGSDPTAPGANAATELVA